MLITLNIQPDDLAPQVIEAYAKAFGWRSVSQDGEVNGYARAKLIESIMDTICAQRGATAAETARAQAIAQVRAAVTIT
jgi:hypothetical protein